MATRRPSVTTYRDDPLYPRITRAVEGVLRRGNVVAPVDVLIEMELLTRERLEEWRHGRVPYLERVIHCNLTRLGRLLRILRFHAHDLNLKPSWTAYMRWGKGPKQRLRFSKTGEPKVTEGRGGVRDALRVAGQGAVLPARAEAPAMSGRPALRRVTEDERRR